MTSDKTGVAHFTWVACSHAAPIGPCLPIADRADTEAKWETESRRLFELKTAAWKPHERDAFGRALGFITDPA